MSYFLYFIYYKPNGCHANIADLLNISEDTKTLEIEQLLADIYKTQTDLVDDDYREQKADVIEAYKKAQEAVEDAKEQ